jgi:hypothetical protein
MDAAGEILHRTLFDRGPVQVASARENFAAVVTTATRVRRNQGCGIKAIRAGRKIKRSHCRAAERSSIGAAIRRRFSGRDACREAIEAPSAQNRGSGISFGRR